MWISLSALLAVLSCSDDDGSNNVVPRDMGPDSMVVVDEDTGVSGDDSGADLDAPVINNPANPDGLGPAIVELGANDDLASAGAYAILSKTGITNVTGSLISGGHLGVSPAPATYITGFSLIADASNEFATSVAVSMPWRVYASDYASPTPVNLTTAVLAMEASYTDAAGRTNPDELNLADGNLGGLTLAPGLYRWGTSVTIPSNVTISGSAQDVWIFQISNDLDVSAAQRVTLSGGASAANIFWQVAGEVVIHENAHFEGGILSQTAVTLQTNASMVGRIYAQSLVALDNNSISTP